MSAMTAKWITRTGESISIEDMSTEHIGNVIAYLERNPERFASGGLGYEGEDPWFDPGTETWMEIMDALKGELILRERVIEMIYR